MSNTNIQLKEYRCPHDNKLLFKGWLIDAEIEVKCKHCHNLIQLQGAKEETVICKMANCARRVA